MIRRGRQAGYISEEFIDLLLIISDSCPVPFPELEPIVQIACLKDRRVVCSLHRQAHVLDALRKGHAFYSLHCIPGNLVYDDSHMAFPVRHSEETKSLMTGYGPGLILFLRKPFISASRPSFCRNVIRLHRWWFLCFISPSNLLSEPS